jgi:hypothetical protein
MPLRRLCLPSAGRGTFFIIFFLVSLLFLIADVDVDAVVARVKVNAWPLSLKRVELHNCMLEDRQVVSLNNRVKPLGCTEVPRMQ